MKTPVAFDFATSGNFCDLCYGVIYKRHSLTTDQERSAYTHLISKPQDQPALHKLHPVKLAHAILTLCSLTDQYDLFGWGSLSYDCHLLHSESEGQAEALRLAYDHVDLMWLLMLHTGHYVSLAEVAAHHKITIDTKLGASIPTLWKSSVTEQRLVIEHHMSQAWAIHAAATEYQASGCIDWVDKRTGKSCKAQLPVVSSNGGLLEQVLSLPQAALTKSINQSVDWIRTAKDLSYATSS